MRLLLTLALLSTASIAVAAPSPNAEDFHARAAALKAQGPLALLETAAIDRLLAEGKAAGQAARSRREAALKAGRKAPYCPPEGKSTMDSSDFFNGLSAIPQAERRRMSLDTATLRILAARYPCPR